MVKGVRSSGGYPEAYSGWHGFYISCVPHKIRGASVGWTRAVAILDDALLAS